MSSSLLSLPSPTGQSLDLSNLVSLRIGPNPWSPNPILVDLDTLPGHRVPLSLSIFTPGVGSWVSVCSARIQQGSRDGNPKDNFGKNYKKDGTE